MPQCGNARQQKRKNKMLQMLQMHLVLRETKAQRRKSLSEIPRFSLMHKIRRIPRLGSQEQSPLFSKLPLEIRTKIYKYVVGDESFLSMIPDLYGYRKGVGCKQGRFRVALCLAPPQEGGETLYKKHNAWDREHSECKAYHDIYWSGPYSMNTEFMPRTPTDRGLGLLTSCRRV